MKNYLGKAALFLGAVACLSGLVREEADGQMFVSSTKYLSRELPEGHRQYPFLTAVNDLDKRYSQNVRLTLSMITDKSEIYEMDRPYMNATLDLISNELPFWAEISTYSGDYFDDTYPEWVAGLYSKDDFFGDNFNVMAGVWGRMGDLRGAKAYTTTTFDDRNGGKFFLDVNPSVGKDLVAVDGKPTVTNDFTWDLYAAGGYRTSDGLIVGGSTNFTGGEFRNATFGVGKTGAKGDIDARFVVNDDGKLGVNFNYRVNFTPWRRTVR